MLVSIFVTALVSVVRSSLSFSPLTIKLSPTHQIERNSLKGQQKQIKEVYANPGTDLLLECHGSNTGGEVTWTSDAERFEIEKKENGIKNHMNVEKPISFNVLEDDINSIKVKLLNVTTFNVGFYFCHQGPISTSMYLYVNDSTLTSSSFYRAYTYLEWKEIVLPCRPSMPDVQVTYKKDPTTFTNIVQNHTKMTYSPLKGFSRPLARADGDTGQYKCFYSRGHDKDEMQVINIIVNHVPLDQSGVSAPVVRVETASGVQHTFSLPDLHTHYCIDTRETSFVNLSCSANIEQGRDASMEWFKERSPRHGNGTLSDPHQSILHGHSAGVINRTKIFWTQLDNVTGEQNGNYTCLVKNQSGENGSKTIELEMKDECDCQLRPVELVTASGSQSECPTINVSGDANITFTMTAKNFDRKQFHWKFGGKFFTWFDCNEGEFSCSVTANNIVINTTADNIEKSGIYNFYCSEDEEGGGEPVTSCIQLSQPPELSLIAGDNNVYHYLDRVHVGCQVTAFPLPDNVTWRLCWTLEAGESCHEEVVNVTIKADAKNYITEADIILPLASVNASLLNLSCVATNTWGRAETPVHTVRVVDYQPPGRDITGYCLCDRCESCQNITSLNSSRTELFTFETQRLTLFCGGILEPNATSQDRRHWRLPSWISSIEEENIIMPRSYIHNIRISELGLTHNGLYHCGNKILDLSVDEISAPILTVTDFNNRSLEVNLTQELTLTCQAQGSPAPETVWFKDDVILRDGDSSSIRIEDESIYIRKDTTFRVVAKYWQVLVSKKEYRRISPGICIAGKIRRSLLITLSFLLFGVLIMLSFTMYYFKKHKSAKATLSDAELKLFIHGDQKSIDFSAPPSLLSEQIYLLPYDTSIEFPIDRKVIYNRLTIGKQIGAGAYGRVLEGVAFGIKENEAQTTVAIKTLNPYSNKDVLKSLMSELKIMSHLGKHSNIVNLLGAVTTNIQKRELYVIVEYCKFGNLQKYIETKREGFISQINPASGKFDDNYPAGIESFLNGSHRFSDVNYSNIVFPNVKPLSNENLKTLTKDNLEAIEKRFLHSQTSITRSPRMPRLPHFSTTTTDSDYLSTIPTETTDFMTSYKVLEDEDNYNEYVSLLDGSLKPVKGIKNSSGNNEDEINHLGPITSKHLLIWAHQVAKGLEYLGSMKILHGDLALRNVLLSENNVIKICDFGLSKNLYTNINYQKLSDSPLPVKWLALETLNYRMFSLQSDIWSYGVVLWELFSLARSPYPGLEPNEEFIRRLEAGHRMEKPSHATDELYQVMLDCWHAEPKLRPTFTELSEKISDILAEGARSQYLELSTVTGTEPPDVVQSSFQTLPRNFRLHTSEALTSSKLRARQLTISNPGYKTGSDGALEMDLLNKK